MASHSHRILTSSQNQNWRTPRWLFDALDKEFNFVLDAAAEARNTLCPLWLGPGSPLCDDALTCPWPDWMVSDLVPRGAIFVNMPYGRRIGEWVERCAEAGTVVPVVGILPHSPQTKWWHKHVARGDDRATEIRLFPRRISFDLPLDAPPDLEANNANVNTAVAIWKPSDGFLDPWAPQTRYWYPDNAPQLKRRRDDPTGRAVDDDDEY